MANELNIDFGAAGLTVTATLIQGNAAVGSPVSLSESGTVTGFYSGNMPAVSSGTYNVRFSGGTGYTGSGVIDWDGTAERRILSLPTNTQFEARTLPTADYFDPATDTVATVTSLTNAVTLPSIPADWITAAGVAADAVAEIQSGLSTVTTAQVRTEADAALAAVGVTSTVTGRIDAAISTRLATSGYTAPLSSGDTTTAVISGLTTYTAPTLAQVQSAGFTTERNDALLAVEAAATAIADGRHAINYTASTATQYNADGTVRTVFDLKDSAGNPATATSAAVERIPQP